MKKLLNTLYITTQGAYLSKERETLCVNIERKLVQKFPVHTLGGVICFGNVMVSPFLMDLCAQNGVSFSFLSEHGRFLARIIGRTSGNVLLRREQYRLADDEKRSAEMASVFITGKLLNSRLVIRRALRDHSEQMDEVLLKKTDKQLKGYVEILKKRLPLNETRGIEGEGSRRYFAVFNDLLLNKEFSFSGRNRRPPLDPVNALLSFLYTLLSHDVRSALESVGLDSSVGFLHRDRPGRPSLALDMMEEFRPVIADRVALSLLNRRQLSKKDFEMTGAGAVSFKNDSRKVVLNAYQNRKREVLTHPFLEEKMEVGLLFHAQALLLARFIRGDLDGYPVYIWR